MHIWRFDYLLPGHGRGVNVLAGYSKFWDRFGVKWHILNMVYITLSKVSENLEMLHLYGSVQAFFRLKSLGNEYKFIMSFNILAPSIFLH